MLSVGYCYQKQLGPQLSHSIVIPLISHQAPAVSSFLFNLVSKLLKLNLIFSNVFVYFVPGSPTRSRMSLSSSTLDRPLRPFSQASGHQVNKNILILKEKDYSRQKITFQTTQNGILRLDQLQRRKSKSQKNIKTRIFQEKRSSFLLSDCKISIFCKYHFCIQITNLVWF